MGTNYYITIPNICPYCKKELSREKFHVGKISIGWVFALHIYLEKNINTLEDWRAIFLSGKQIKNEYGAIVLPEIMFNIIENLNTKKSDFSWEDAKIPHGYDSWEDFHEKNHSEEGPHGLLRRKIDNTHCIGHGSGTYDYCVGEFD